jgi:hypothetical protein
VGRRSPDVSSLALFHDACTFGERETGLEERTLVVLRPNHFEKNVFIKAILLNPQKGKIHDSIRANRVTTANFALGFFGQSFFNDNNARKP